MLDVKITVMKITRYDDLIKKYENNIEDACSMHVGDTFISHDAKCPEGFCVSAWETLFPFVDTLSKGGGDFFSGWMKNPYSAMLSCNDGCRPVTFLVEAIIEK